MQHITIFGIKLTIDPVAFTIPIGGGFNVHWYGIIIALGFMLAVIYAIKNAPRFKINTDHMLDVIIFTTPVAIFCARAYYIIFDPSGQSSFKEFFGPDGLSGIGIYGGVIGAFGFGALMCRFKRINILDMFDLTAISFLIGQGIGRWGNFINQEAFGSATGSSWFGMTSENVVHEFTKKGLEPTALAHPCFLYESIWCIAGFFVLNHFAKKRKFSGEITLLYCAWYGFERAIVENLRMDSLMLGNFRVSVLVAIITCVAAIVTLIVIRKKQKTAATDCSYVDVFKYEDDDILEEQTNE